MNRHEEQAPIVIDLEQMPRYPARRRTRQPIAFVVLGTAAVAASMFAVTPIEPDAGRAPAAHAFEPRLVTPATASAGERIPVLAYLVPGPCGGTELRLDGAPVVQRLTRYAVASDRLEVFLTLDVPASTTAGRHEIELVATACDGVGDSRLGTAAIDVTVGAAVGTR